MITRRFAVPLFVALCAVIFLLDAHTPLGVAEWVVYVLPTLLIYRTKPAHYLIPSTVVCAILIVLGFFVSLSGIAIEMAIFNRSSGVVVLFVLAFLLRNRKQAEEKVARLTRVYTVLSKINQAIVRIRDREKLFEEACRVAVDDGKFILAWIGLVDDETKIVKVVAHKGISDGYLENLHISIDDEPEGRGPTGTALRESRYVICNDIEHDERLVPWREQALKLGYRSSAAFPLRVAARTQGSLNFYSGETGFFDQDEVSLLEELALDISYAMEFMEREELRQKAEEALRDNERKLIEAQKIGRVGHWVLDLTTNRLTWSDEIYRIFGIDPRQFGASYEAFLNTVHPDDRDMVNYAYTESLRNRSPYDIVHRLLLADGTVKYVNERCESEYDPQGKPLRSLGTVQDITERKKAEENLRNAEERYRSTLDHMLEGCQIIDFDWRYLYVNDVAAAHGRHTKEELLGRTMMEMYPGIENTPMFAKLRHSMEQRVPQRME
ncbi:MAG: GAF domain-containing protein, partial [Bacteroidota bacterium]